MKKIIVIMFFTLIFFVACDKLNVGDYKKFSYDKNISLYGTPKNNQKIGTCLVIVHIVK